MTSLAVDVVKRRKKRGNQQFDPAKLRTSVYMACLSLKTPEGEAASTSQSVADAVVLWVTTKPAVTTGDIRRKTAEHLAKYHPDAAYIYQNHRVIM